MNKQRVTLRVL